MRAITYAHSRRDVKWEPRRRGGELTRNGVHHGCAGAVFPHPAPSRQSSGGLIRLRRFGRHRQRVPIPPVQRRTARLSSRSNSSQRGRGAPASAHPPSKSAKSLSAVPIRCASGRPDRRDLRLRPRKVPQNVYRNSAVVFHPRRLWAERLPSSSAAACSAADAECANGCA
jgi:hypothetical protein